MHKLTSYLYINFLMVPTYQDEIQEVEEFNDALSSSFPSRPLEALK